jgi:virulence factor Mce-like protein
MRRSRTSAVASPVLVGAVTVLVVVVAVFLAYNANSGLPFVPTSTLKVRVPNGANLVPGNEVRAGGFRVGVVDDMEPVQLASGEVGAELTLKLDERVGDVPVDSTFRIRPRSALGLKYVELTEGKSREAYANGDTVPVSRSSIPVELDEVYELFDERTRAASQQNLEGFGDAFAARGTDIGRTIEEAPGLLGSLERVMHNLADPATELDRFFAELGDAARIVAPVAGTHAHLYTSMADTFAAIARDERALEQTIVKAPPTMDAAVASFRVQRPFLSDTAAFSADLRGAARELRAALPMVNSALETGIPVQRKAVELNADLETALSGLRDLAEAPTTNPALRGLTSTVATLNPQLRFLGPFVTVCNSWNYFWTHLAEHMSEPDVTGSAQRALLNSTGKQKNSVGSMGATRPANGQDVQEGTPQYGQDQPYAAAIDAQGRADCETGQRGYIERQALGYPSEYRIARDPRTPGLQGPTYTGRPHVPAGQTFTHKPETSLYSQMGRSETGDE